VGAADANSAAVTAYMTWMARGERAQLKLLNQINQSVNREVKKANDLDLYGQPEYWSLPRRVDGRLYGDCEDYALEKRRQLIAAGVPESALSLAVAFTARGESHAVLMISLKSGDWVLGNLTPWVDALGRSELPLGPAPGPGHRALDERDVNLDPRRDVDQAPNLGCGSFLWRQGPPTQTAERPPRRAERAF